MEARLSLFGSPVTAKFGKHIIAAGKVLADSTLPAATRHLRRWYRTDRRAPGHGSGTPTPRTWHSRPRQGRQASRTPGTGGYRHHSATRSPPFPGRHAGTGPMRIRKLPRCLAGLPASAQIKPASRTIIATCTRLAAFSLDRTRETCAFTVASLM